MRERGKPPAARYVSARIPTFEPIIIRNRVR